MLRWCNVTFIKLRLFSSQPYLFNDLSDGVEPHHPGGFLTSCILRLRFWRSKEILQKSVFLGSRLKTIYNKMMFALTGNDEVVRHVSGQFVIYCIRNGTKYHHRPLESS